MADPEFPEGGVDLVGGEVDSRGSYVSKILYVETKEFGPLGGVRRARPLRSASVVNLYKVNDLFVYLLLSLHKLIKSMIPKVFTKGSVSTIVS